MSQMKPKTPRPPPAPPAPTARLSPPADGDEGDTCSTLEVARRLGMAVRSVQMMVDRGDLQAWKTPGGHRRISRASVDAWIAGRGAPAAPGLRPSGPAGVPAPSLVPVSGGPRVLLIEDSRHFQNLVSLIVRRHLPTAELHVADDGIAGLAMAGRLDPDLLLVDILLPGIDGATLITSLRSHPQFGRSQLVVVTSLDDTQRSPFAFALEGLPVVHKTRLVQELPGHLATLFPAAVAATAAPPAAGD